MIQTTCPNCGYKYDLNEEISKEVNQKIKENELLREQLEEIRHNSENAKIVLRKKLEEEIKSEMENKIKELQEQKDDENRLLQKRIEDITNSSANTKNVLRKEVEEEIKCEMENKIKEIQEQKDEENKVLQKRLEDTEKTRNELRKELEEEINNEMENKIKEKIKEKEKQDADKINALEMQIEKMKAATRKASDVADNTSNDIKGKLGEFNLETLIRGLFHNDMIIKIGTRGGGDFVQTVIDGNHKCGKILYECKYAEKFNRSEWIPKIKEDSLLEHCDRNVIVTKVMPVGNDDTGKDIRIDKIDPCRIDGVWICSYNSVAGVINLLRDSVVHQDIANVSQFDRSNKKEDLYEYIVSNEFMNDGNNFRDALVKRRNYLEDYLKRTVRSIKVQIDETSGLITKFDNLFTRITDITGKCADTEILDKEEENEEFLRSILDTSKGNKKKKSLDRKQYTIDDVWN